MKRRDGGFFVFVVVFVVSMFIYAGDVSGGGEKKKGVLFSESYEDGDLHGRGWYDGRKFKITEKDSYAGKGCICLLYTSPSPRDLSTSRMPSSA